MKIEENIIHETRSNCIQEFSTYTISLFPNFFSTLPPVSLSLSLSLSSNDLNLSQSQKLFEYE